MQHIILLLAVIAIGACLIVVFMAVQNSKLNARATLSDITLGRRYRAQQRREARVSRRFPSGGKFNG